MNSERDIAASLPAQGGAAVSSAALNQTVREHGTMTEKQSEYCIGLVKSALDDLEAENARLSAVIRKCLRIARLRNDFDNLWWLNYELLDLSTDNRIAVQEFASKELSPHYTRDLFEQRAKEYEDAFVAERKFPDLQSAATKKPKLLNQNESIEIIESRIASLEADLFGPPAPHNQGVARMLRQQQINNLKKIVARVSQRVHTFLSLTEAQLLAGQVNADIFERNREYVDSQLKKIAPDALEKFAAVYKRVEEGEEEAKSQALLSCRRILKCVADAVYPASNAAVVGSDGLSRVLTEDGYIARLWQFVFERLGQTTSSKLIKVQIEDLGHRIDRVYDLANKGTHVTVSDFELDQCASQTYLLVGDLLRIHDQGAA